MCLKLNLVFTIQYYYTPETFLIDTIVNIPSLFIVLFVNRSEHFPLYNNDKYINNCLADFVYIRSDLLR